MAQRTKFSGARVIPGDGTDAGNALFQIHPQLGPFRGAAEPHRLLQLLAAPAQGYPGGIPRLLQSGAHLPDVMHSHTVDLYNLVADFQTGLLGLIPQQIVKGGNGNGVVPQLQSHRLPHRYQ